MCRVQSGGMVGCGGPVSAGPAGCVPEDAWLFEEIGILIRGMVLGVMIAAPVGPIGLLCIRRTVERGLPAGLSTGLGAALADTMFSAVAAFGVTAILEMITGYEMQLKLVGGLFLLGVALHSFLRTPKPPAQTQVATDLWHAAVSGFGLTISNPITILGIMALVIGFGGSLDGIQAATLVCGIMIGSGIWWGVLCGGVSLIRHHFTVRTVGYINKGTAVALAGFGLWVLASIFWGGTQPL